MTKYLFFNGVLFKANLTVNSSHHFEIRLVSEGNSVRAIIS